MLFKCCWKSAMRKWERVTFRSCHLQLARWSARFPESEWVKGNSWSFLSIPYSRGHDQSMYETRSSWLNCGLRGDEAVYWVSIGQHGWYLAVPRQYETVIDVVGSVEGTDAFIYWKIGDLVRCYWCPNRLTDSQTLKDRATQLWRVEERWISRGANTFLANKQKQNLKSKQLICKWVPANTCC